MFYPAFNLTENPFKYWDRAVEKRKEENGYRCARALLYEMHVNDPDEYEDPRKIDGVKVYLKREGSLLYSKADYAKWKMGFIHHHGKNSAKSDWNICRIAEILEVGGEKDNKKNPLRGLEEPLCDYQEVYDLATHHLYHGIKAYEIRENPQNYVLMFTYWDSNELFDLIPIDHTIPSATYISACARDFETPLS